MFKLVYHHEVFSVPLQRGSQERALCVYALEGLNVFRFINSNSDSVALRREVVIGFLCQVSPSRCS